MNSCWKDTHRYIFHSNKVKYTFTWSIHEVRNNQMVKEYFEIHPRRFLEIFFALSTPHRLRINSKKTKTQCLSYFLVWKTMMVLKADDRCHATVHKGLQTLVWISCTWESIQKKLVCRRIRDGPLEKFFLGVGEFSSRRNFFSSSNSL